MILITLLVPMYNEEKNIKRCVETLKNQNNQNFNVIFIDDGSTDFTIQFLEDALSYDISFNYKIVRQINRGACEARRVGAAISNTPYIMAYDCDDYLSIDMVNEFYNTYSIYSNADIIMPRMSIQNNDGTWRNLLFFSNDKVLNPEECVKNTLQGWNVHGCFAIKRKVFLKSYNDYMVYNSNNTNYVNNDEVITRLNFSNSQLIIRNEAIYYYCHNLASTTKSINQNLYLTIYNAIILDKIYSSDSYLYEALKINLISNLWGMHQFLKQNKSDITNLPNWNMAIREGLKHLKSLKILRLIPFKQKVKLAILVFDANLNPL